MAVKQKKERSAIKKWTKHQDKKKTDLEKWLATHTHSLVLERETIFPHLNSIYLAGNFAMRSFQHAAHNTTNRSHSHKPTISVSLFFRWKHVKETEQHTFAWPPASKYQSDCGCFHFVDISSIFLEHNVCFSAKCSAFHAVFEHKMSMSS